MLRLTLVLAVTTTLALQISVAADDAPSLGGGGGESPGLPLVLPPNEPSAADAPAAPLAAAAPLVAAPVQGPAAPTIGAPPSETRQLVLDPSQPAQLAYFSPRLGARFLIQPMSLPQFGSFWGATIVSPPAPGSPLLQLGLVEGDVVTRLDGLPVTTTLELERHILATSLRFLRAGEPSVQIGTVFIDPGMYFLDPYAPQCPLSGGCNPVALRP